jgi:hypothetical protein
MYRVTKRETVDVNGHNHYLVLVYLTTLTVPQGSDDMMIIDNELEIIRNEAMVA